MPKPVTPIIAADALIELFPCLLREVCNGPKYGLAFRDIILALPMEWLKANVETYAEAILTAEDPAPDDLEYDALFGLYMEIDRDMAVRLVDRALQNTNEHILAVGRELREILDEE